MIRRFLLSAAFLLAAMIMVANGGTASAQVTNVGNGMRLSPVRSDLTIKPGESATIDVYIRNITNADAKLKGIVNDFIASDDESGNPRIILDETKDNPDHGLKKYIEKVEPFSLAPNEQKIIKVKVNIPKDAAAGGYYGAVRFLPSTVDDSKNLSLTASVGSLILVTVPGDLKEQAGIESLNVTRGEEGKASNLFVNGTNLRTTIRINNSGNVQVSPFGKVLLKKGDKTLSEYEVNSTQPRGNVLPDSVRRFNVEFGDKTKTLGKYTVEANLGYGASGQLISAKTTFWVVPLPIIITLVVCLLAIIAAIVLLPRMMKSHDRKLVRKVRRNG